MKNLNVYKKITASRQLIKGSPLKKQGKNTYSGYDYFTPDQVDKLVNDACKENGLFTKFDLIRHEEKIMGILEIIDLESGESTDFKMAMDIPEIKATNISQQLGGAMTYCKRYLLMNAFDIADNSIDFDANKQEGKRPEKTVNEPNKWLNKFDKNGKATISYLNVIKKAKEKCFTAEDIRKYYKISKENFEHLKTDLA